MIEAYMTAMGSSEALGQLEEQGVSYPLYVLIGAVASVKYGPPVNMIAALGEEIGCVGSSFLSSGNDSGGKRAGSSAA